MAILLSLNSLHPFVLVSFYSSHYYVKNGIKQACLLLVLP